MQGYSVVVNVITKTRSSHESIFTGTAFLFEGGRDAAEHVAWLEGHMADRDRLHTLSTTQNERLAELDRTLRERIGELVAAQAEREVRTAYTAHLQESLGLPPDTPQAFPPSPPGSAAAHAAVDRAITALHARPRAQKAVSVAARLARRARS